MTDERRLFSERIPPEDSTLNCCSTQREVVLPDYVLQQKNPHVCKCGGSGNCPDCPNRKK